VSIKKIEKTYDTTILQILPLGSLMNDLGATAALGAPPPILGAETLGAEILGAAGRLIPPPLDPAMD